MFFFQCFEDTCLIPVSDTQAAIILIFVSPCGVAFFCLLDLLFGAGFKQFYYNIPWHFLCVPCVCGSLSVLDLGV